MARINIYIPEDLALDVRSFPGEVNLSQICAAAIRAELATRSEHRQVEPLFDAVFQEPRGVEVSLMQRFKLRTVVARPARLKDEPPSDAIAHNAARFLDRVLLDGLKVAVAGGSQVWNTVRRLAPRNVALDLWALGYGHVDAQSPHVHANAIVTLLSVLYAPRSQAHLVATTPLGSDWQFPALFPSDARGVRRVIVGSCAPFEPQSPYANLLGKEMTDFLVEERVMGDFLGVFLTPDGRLVEPYAPAMTVSHIPSSDLRGLAKRDDTVVLLAAGGRHKKKLMHAVIAAGLCNGVVTDVDTAYSLVGYDPRWSNA